MIPENTTDTCTKAVPHAGSPQEELAWVWAEYKRTGDRALRNRLIVQYLYLVKVIGNRIAARLPRSIDVQDLRSAGVFGLMSAIQHFDLERGTPFESYCARRVRGAILDELRSQDWVPRLVRHRATAFHQAQRTLRERLGREPSTHETAEEMGTSPEVAERLRRDSNLTSVFTLAPQDEREDDPRVLRRLDVLMDKDSEIPFERMVSHDLATHLFQTLHGHQRTVIALYYKEGLTMKEIGRVMGISESRVCQIHSQTLRRLKAQLDALGERGLTLALAARFGG
jgi:RNA polymerase sigma factor for flagellar operon FliA